MIKEIVHSGPKVPVVNSVCYNRLREPVITTLARGARGTRRVEIEILKFHEFVWPGLHACTQNGRAGDTLE